MYITQGKNTKKRKKKKCKLLFDDGKMVGTTCNRKRDHKSWQFNK